jgi:hypothetical protein
MITGSWSRVPRAGGSSLDCRRRGYSLAMDRPSSSANGCGGQLDFILGGSERMVDAERARWA